MVQAMDQGAIEGALDGTCDGSGSKWRSDESMSDRRSDGWYKRWIGEQVKERRMVQAMDHGEILGAMDGTSEGSGSKWRSDGSGS